MTTTHARVATLAATLADQVVSSVGTSSTHRTADLRRALVQAITQHLQRSSVDQLSIDNSAPGR